jgi:hypothetical protein
VHQRVVRSWKLHGELRMRGTDAYLRFLDSELLRRLHERLAVPERRHLQHEDQQCRRRDLRCGFRGWLHHQPERRYLSAQRG